MSWMTAVSPRYIAKKWKISLLLRIQFKKVQIAVSSRWGRCFFKIRKGTYELFNEPKSERKLNKRRFKKIWRPLFNEANSLPFAGCAGPGVLRHPGSSRKKYPWHVLLSFRKVAISFSPPRVGTIQSHQGACKVKIR